MFAPPLRVPHEGISLRHTGISGLPPLCDFSVDETHSRNPSSFPFFQAMGCKHITSTLNHHVLAFGQM